MKAIKEDKKSGAGGGKDAEVKSSGQQSEQGLPHGMKSLSNGFKQMNSLSFHNRGSIWTIIR